MEIIRGGGGKARIGNLDRLGRPTGVRARLNPKAINQGTRASGKLKGLRRGLDDRTHLLARELGGRGIKRLLIVSSRGFNRKIMRGPERLARRELNAGNNIIYEAIPQYIKGQRRPVAVFVRITRVGKKGPDGKKGADEVVFDRRLTGTR